MSISVVVIEDHPLMMKAILEELSSQSDIQVVGTADRGSELPRLVRESLPAVVILDLGMSTETFEPLSAVRSILQDYPDLRILVLTGFDDDIYVHQIIQAGAYGYVLKSDDLSLMLPKGVRKVFDGKRFSSEEVIDRFFNAQKTNAIVLNDQEAGCIEIGRPGTVKCQYCANDKDFRETGAQHIIKHLF